MGKTLYEKIWDDHLVAKAGTDNLIYIDRHLIHEVTSLRPLPDWKKRVANCAVLTVPSRRWITVSPPVRWHWMPAGPPTSYS